MVFGGANVALNVSVGGVMIVKHIVGLDRYVRVEGVQERQLYMWAT